MLKTECPKYGIKYIDTSKNRNEILTNILKEKYEVIAVIGDGSLTGGMALEALNDAGSSETNVTVILNDNEMSISKNVGGIPLYLSKIRTKTGYTRSNRKIKEITKKIPVIGKPIISFAHYTKQLVKRAVLPNMYYEDIGFTYLGPIDGHDIKKLEDILRRSKQIKGPVIIHVVTKKGKGYEIAEKNPDKFHGISAYNKQTGETIKKKDYSQVFGETLVKLAEKDQKIVAVTAAMRDGTGLKEFSQKFPDRFFDVGIAEEHAVTFAGGLAVGGMIPVVCIYSTFIQRSIDQIIHDVTLQNAHVIFMLDRAGAVPSDGVTHQGIFDISLLRPIPKLNILSVASADDLKLCLEWASESKDATVIRYPKLSCPTELPQFKTPVEIGRGIFIPCSEIIIENISEVELENRKNKILVVSTGGMFNEVHTAVHATLMDNGYSDIYLLRFIKPIDLDYFWQIAQKYHGVVFVEDGVQIGGISEYLNSFLLENNFTNTKILAFEDKFYEHGSRFDVCKCANLTSQDIASAIKELSAK